MARPIKKGLDYFPLDTRLHGRIEYIQCMYGMLGVMVVISLWQRIYENSYYIEYNEKSALIFSKDFGVQLELLSKGQKSSWEVFDEIVRQSVKEGLFDEALFEKYGILTSRKIQENYLKAKEKSSKIEFYESYLLLSDADFSVSSPKIVVISPKTGVSSPENATEYSRVEESKVNESIVEESSNAVLPAAVSNAYEQWMSSKPTSSVEKDINSFIDKGVEVALIVRLIEYARENNKTGWAYAKAAIKGNMDAGIKTLDEYNRAQEERAENAKKVQAAEKSGKGKFNNYNDTNKPDYSNFGDEIINGMLEEGSKE